MNGNVLYSAVVLDQESHDRLINVFLPMIPKDWEILAHHMTIKLGEIDSLHRNDLGKQVELTVIDYAKDFMVMAVGVEGYYTQNNKAHITVAVNRHAGGKPMMSNKLDDWQSINFPLKVTGVVTEVSK